MLETVRTKFLKYCDSEIKELSALYAAEEEEETDETREARMSKEIKALPQIYALARLMQNLRSGKGADSSGPPTSKKK